MEVAETYKTARVIGMDLSPIQPTAVPWNCDFMVGDLREDLEDFDDGSMDLIQSRLIHAGIKEDEWPKFVREMFRALKPGNGWAQCTESGMPHFEGDVIPEDSVLPKFFEYFARLFRSKGLLTSGARHLVSLFEEAGFTDIEVIEKIVDIGDWRGDPKTAAQSRAAARAFGDVWPTLADLNFKEFIHNDDERRAFGVRAKEEFCSGQYRCYFKMEMVIGRKPSPDGANRPAKKSRRF